MTLPAKPKHILLVDDEAGVRKAIRLLLAAAGYRVESAGSAEEALACLDAGTFDLVITDNSMPGKTGADLALAIKARSPALPVVMLSANPPDGPAPCLDLILRKPGDIPILLESVKAVLEGLQ